VPLGGKHRPPDVVNAGPDGRIIDGPSPPDFVGSGSMWAVFLLAISAGAAAGALVGDTFIALVVSLFYGNVATIMALAKDGAVLEVGWAGGRGMRREGPRPAPSLARAAPVQQPARPPPRHRRAHPSGSSACWR